MTLALCIAALAVLFLLAILLKPIRRAAIYGCGLTIAGLTVWARCSDGSLKLISYHPRSSLTWVWSVGLTRRQPHLKRAFCFTSRELRRCQWHDYVKLPRGWALSISRQDYHRRPVFA